MVEPPRAAVTSRYPSGVPDCVICSAWLLDAGAVIVCPTGKISDQVLNVARAVSPESSATWISYDVPGCSNTRLPRYSLLRGSNQSGRPSRQVLEPAGAELDARRVRRAAGRDGPVQ